MRLQNVINQSSFKAVPQTANELILITGLATVSSWKTGKKRVNDKA